MNAKKLLLPFILLAFKAFSQGGYDIKITVKDSKDTVGYLAGYTWDQKYVVDTCKKVKNGIYNFKGKKNLDKGVYFLVSQDKVKYFDLFINEDSKFSMATDMADVEKFMKITGSKENETFVNYKSFMIGKNAEFVKTRDKTKGMNKTDSIKFMNDAVKKLNEEVLKFNTDFAEKTKGTFFGDFLNLTRDKVPAELPKASNGRPDSVYQYHYIKAHFFDGINFKDDRLIHTPFFSERITGYFDRMVFPHPDSIIVEIDKIMDQCIPNSDMSNTLLSYFTPKYESSKIVGFDKVFVHIIEKYIATGKAEFYGKTSIEKIVERGKILKPLLLGNKAPDLFMIDTVNAKVVNKMGYDTAKTQEGLTKLYQTNMNKLAQLYTTLYNTQAKYTVLVFWDVDCGHCKTEIPKLNETYRELKKKYDIKIIGVYTKHEYDKWRKYIIENKLEFINVWDPMHINNISDKYDIFSTPVIYVLDKDKIILSKKLSEEQIPDVIKVQEAIEKEKQKK
jgi:hypothetical protein